MGDTFHACSLPWTVWPWGLRLTHSDTDVVPECSVEFGAMALRQLSSHEDLWVRVDFDLAAYASAMPRRDDERLPDVSGYDIVPRRGPGGEDARPREAEWLSSGRCPDPQIYFSTDSRWLEASRGSWAERQRTGRSSADAVHFVMDGRDGYIEIMAAGFSWRAWRPGQPRLSEVTGEPIMSGRWAPG